MKTDTDNKQDDAQNASTVRDCPGSAGSRRDEYMYADIADFEETVGYKVNESFVAGFRMARMKWGPVINKVESDGGEITFENKGICK